jgi:hypothetical protein
MALIMLLLTMPGCSAAAVSTATSTAAVLAETSATTSPAPIMTPTPAQSLLPSPSPSPKPSPFPSPAPTPKPTVTPAADSGKVTLAEGFYYVKLDAALKTRITGMSYPAAGSDSQISYADLRYVKLLYYDFEGVVHEGELIVHAQLAAEVMAIFYELYQAKYPLSSVRLVDDYGEPGDDNLSMAANNTSAFTGSTTLSRHSYGAAVDINPLFNPYLDGDRISPANGAAYADRSLDFAGKIDHDDLCYKLFIAHGWTWGGDWSGDPDYQHFSKKIE